MILKSSPPFSFNCICLAGSPWGRLVRRSLMSAEARRAKEDGVGGTGARVDLEGGRSPALSLFAVSLSNPSKGGAQVTIMEELEKKIVEKRR